MPETTQLAGEAQRRGPEGRGLRARLFERVMDRIHGYFVKLVWDPQGVDECLQRTLVRLETSLTDGSYDPERSFNRWMWLKAHSVYVDYCRERGRQPGALPPGDELEAVSTTPAVERELDAEAVLERMRDELDPECFEAFVLRYQQSCTVTQIADLLGRARKTVRKRLETAERFALRMLRPEEKR